MGVVNAHTLSKQGAPPQCMIPITREMTTTRLSSPGGRQLVSLLLVDLHSGGHTRCRRGMCADPAAPCPVMYGSLADRAAPR